MLALLALASSAVWGTADFVGGLYAKRIAAVRVVAYSQMGGLLVISAVLLAVHAGGSWSMSGWPLPAVASGLTGAVGLTAFYAALSSGTMGVVSPIAALGAVVPVVLGLATGDQVGAVALLGMAIAVAGAALASGPELSGAAAARPLVLAVLAAGCFGLSLFFLDRAAAYDVVAGLWGMRVTSVVVLSVLLLVLALRRRSPGPQAARRDLPGLLVLGCGDLLANALFALASTHGFVSVAAVLGSLYPVATLLWARLLLHERLRAIQSVGVALTVVGVVLTTA